MSKAKAQTPVNGQSVEEAAEMAYAGLKVLLKPIYDTFEIAPKNNEERKENTVPFLLQSWGNIIDPQLRAKESNGFPTAKENLDRAEKNWESLESRYTTNGSVDIDRMTDDPSYFFTAAWLQANETKFSHLTYLDGVIRKLFEEITGQQLVAREIKASPVNRPKSTEEQKHLVSSFVQQRVGSSVKHSAKGEETRPRVNLPQFGFAERRRAS